MSDQIMSSRKMTKRNLKVLFWGNTGTRKTEAILRAFPHTFLIDVEGNSDQCADNPDIPEYLVVKTKDPRKVLEWIDKVAAGKVKFEDGSPVETLAIDGYTVLWNVQKEFAAVNAEKRASRYNKAIEEAGATQLDWGLAKRPLGQIANRMNNLAVKYLVLTAREAPLYKEGAESVKIGERPDVVKGTEYEMNLILRFFNESGAWGYETTKVQGTLSSIFPVGKRGKQIPYKELFAYASSIKPVALKEKSEADLAGEQADDANHSKEELIAYAKEKGLDLPGVGKALKAGGFTEVDLTRWKDMIKAIDAVVA